MPKPGATVSPDTRPIDSYQQRGWDAEGRGIRFADCPYPEGSLAHADWELGWKEQALDIAKVLSDDREIDDEELHHARADVGLARRRRAVLLYRAGELVPSPEAAATAIGLPVESWKGRCHEVASLLLASGALQPLIDAHGSAQARYGIYEGPILEGSPFHGRPLARHGWVEFDSGLVVDPTRWVFTNTQPEIWVGGIEDYDMGAARLKLRTSGPKQVPAFNDSQRVIRLAINDPETLQALGDLLQDKGRLVRDGTVSLNQVVWLGNLHPEVLGDHLGALHQALDSAGCGAFIPVDFRRSEKAGMRI